MKVIDWIFLLFLSSIFLVIVNLLSTDSTILESMMGALVLAGVSLAGVIVNKAFPKFPIIINICVIGFLIAIPISPISHLVIDSTSKIGFMAPIVAVGAFAGIGMGEHFKSFKQQGWKMVLVVAVVYFSTFFFSALVAQIVMFFTGTSNLN